MNQDMERIALLIILLLAPHTKVPGVELVYPFRLADIFIIATSILYLRIGTTSNSYTSAGRAMMVCYLLTIMSMVWGMYFLSSLELQTIIEKGKTVGYVQFAVRKLLLLAVSFLGFQWMMRTRATSNEMMLKYWYWGLCIAVVLHALSYLLSADGVTRHAGVFVEGNHAGSYYLMSFFLMWWSTRLKVQFGCSGMVISFVGIILTQSTAAAILIVLLGPLAYMLQINNAKKKTSRILPLLIGLFALILILSTLGREVATKLIGEELNPSSFSRYDRITSAISGINMFAANPLFGVGVQGYAFALPRFADSFLRSFFDWNYRRITNNIYIELLAEQGAIGLTAMGWVIYRMVSPTFRYLTENAILCAAIMTVLLGWFAFPSYTISFQWIGLALVCRLTLHNPSPPKSA